MVFLMAGGGTGGHVIPGIAVAQELAARGHTAIFAGTRTGMEARLVPAAGFPLEWIEIGGLQGQGLLRRLKTVAQLPGAIWKARGILRKHRVAGVFSMGGYVAAPVVVAAAITGTPIVQMEPNAMPGLTNRRLARFAKQSLLQFAEAVPYFPKERAELAGLPVRAGFFTLPERTAKAKPVILITGGSRGARRLNLAAEEMWPLLSRRGLDVRMVLQCGRDMHANLAESFRASGVEGEVVPFIDDMPAAFGAADLIVCRSGAGTMAELAAAGKPSILVPYPYAADDHQMANARAMERVGAARVVADQECTGERLLDEVQRCLASGVLEGMAASARSMAKPGAAKRAADLLEQYTKNVF
jgi:UDP-N-acetylglucosamine--N-acetylmuramyl-(pentapeptide) pyrophosphoryl-undecaprenol N-acetylglucosamine transferase